MVLSRKADIDEALRHPEMFTSNMSAVDLKNVRPLIPLQIDPPDHKKYRKLLDPIFAPRLMTAMEEEVAVLVNDLIDRFIERGEVDFSAEFSVPYPSQVFLKLLGLPPEELDRFLTMKDGIIRPDHVTGSPYGSDVADAHQQEVADSIYAYFNQVLDEREQEPRADLVSRFLSAEVDGHTLTREDILDICFLFLIAGLDTVTATLDCMFALPFPAPRAPPAVGRRSDPDPIGHRGAPALGDPGADGGPRLARGHDLRRLPGEQG